MGYITGQDHTQPNPIFFLEIRNFVYIFFGNNCEIWPLQQQEPYNISNWKKKFLKNILTRSLISQFGLHINQFIMGWGNE